MSWFFNELYCYQPLDDAVYYKRFGIKQKNDKYEIEDKRKLKNAYKKAWENRNFEINKLWTRAAYFWGFIVLIFGGYITLITSNTNEKALALNIDLYLLLLGFLFSLAWFLVIRGSKRWQENWEAHIDKLEDFISGPLYKTIHYSGKTYYSVSKLNEILALIVIFVWIALILQYSVNNLNFICDVDKIDYQKTIPILVAIVFAFVLTFGYCRGDYKSDKDKFFDRLQG